MSQNDTVSIDQFDLAFLVQNFVRSCVERGQPDYNTEYLDQNFRKYYPMLDDHYRRRVVMDIEVAIAVHNDSKPEWTTPNLQYWKAIVKEFRPARSEFTVDYHCHSCLAREVKLWRGVNGCSNAQGQELLCARCLAPNQVVDKDGRAEEIKYKIGIMTDQVNGWLPAVPVASTFWGYSSVPSQDVEWWRDLPTYLPESEPDNA